MNNATPQYLINEWAKINAMAEEIKKRPVKQTKKHWLWKEEKPVRKRRRL